MTRLPYLRRVTPLLLIACGGPSAPHAGAPSAAAVPGRTVFTVLTQDRKSGYATITRAGNVVRTHIEFVDRGRGPRYDIAYVVEPERLLSAFDAKGTDYWKKPFEEHFTLQG